MGGIVTRNLPDQLVELLRERILSGIAAPGDPVRQDALAAELGVSKIPLREAMARLEQEGLLRSEANRGYFVRELTAAEAREVYDLRLNLEPAAAAAAAANATTEDREIAEAALEALDAATEAHEAQVGVLNRAFHLALVRPARQSVTFEIIERLHILSERYVRKHLEPHGRDSRANREHRDLLDAWLARDGKTVSTLLSAHIGQTQDDLARQLIDQ
ncbi:GntR family transcriptional regulator [Sphingosinicella sp. LHD-64]|uniref:GntR family transcriptional regulator n=1 Tax=Sphingosinicella sp. LHD-64 TaxID=3072139 RepID=UPI00280FC074|nr:GntR family transcriptional regulator [Sphingosinicella sp. LHD-64]MDQ8757792.1 GntR family transcriptional regulator [Sphingosinicella sp. LHD-64]